MFALMANLVCKMLDTETNFDEVLTYQRRTLTYMR